MHRSNATLAASIPRARYWLRTVATLVVFVAIATQSFKVHAELVFRSLQQGNGQTSWSGIKKYSNAADVSYPQNGNDRLSAPVDEVRVYLSGEITRKDHEYALVGIGCRSWRRLQ